MTPLQRIPPRIVALVLLAIPLTGSGIDEDDLEFRFWRNIEGGKAFKAALIAYDKPTGRIQLYLSNGKKFVAELKDYHAEDKAYVKEWLEWKAYVEKKAAQSGASGRTTKGASSAIKQALDVRFRVNRKSPRSSSKGTTREESTVHEIVVQVSTRENAGKIPKGQLHVTAYVRHDLNNGKWNGGKFAPARRQRSSTAREVKPKPVTIGSFKPGKTTEHKFNVTTKNREGRQGTFNWKHEQELVGVRARLLVGGQLADEMVYPSDLDRVLKQIRR